MISAKTRRGIPITVVLVILAAGLLLYALAHWRRGSAVLGAAALVAGVLRAVVSEGDIGVLAVRSRAFDVLFLLAIGIAFELLAFWPE